VFVPLLAVVGMANAWNLQGWPGRVNDDEGTYVAEAWAMIAQHHLSHYTYWYDHPPLGWALMAAWIWVTRGFQRYPSAVMAGREVMWVATLVSCTLLYVLARRLQIRQAAAAAAVVVFGLSPLAIYYHRMVFLDNLAVMWMLAALAIAASPRRSLAAALWSAVCFAVAVLSKETIVLLAPVVVWVLCQHTDRRTRSWHLTVFGTACALILLGYPLFAALRGELFPSKGHVSLLGALYWQFFERPGSGSLLDPHSGTFGLARFWVGLDPWLLLGGVALVPAAAFVRKLWAMALALALQVLVLFMGGYVPYAYVTAMLPFAALLIAGVADTWWTPHVFRSRAGHSRVRRGSTAYGAGWWIARAGRGPVIAGAVVFALAAATSWWHVLASQAKVDGDASELAATAWIEHNVPSGSVVVVDDYMWPDLKMRSDVYPLWLWKVNTDPWVTKHVLPHGYASIDYIVLAPQAPSTLATLPTLKAALEHSRVLKSFGDGIAARVVVKPHLHVRHRIARCSRRGLGGGIASRCRNRRCVIGRAKRPARSCRAARPFPAALRHRERTTNSLALVRAASDRIPLQGGRRR
jgi:4-amino-4-deoxy-L-arabinose transferase-like glycosyltransferase